MAKLYLPWLFLQLGGKAHPLALLWWLLPGYGNLRNSDISSFSCAHNGSWALWESRSINQKGMWWQRKYVSVCCQSLNWLYLSRERGDTDPCRLAFSHEGSQNLSSALFFCFFFIPTDVLKGNWIREWVSLVSSRAKSYAKCFWLRTELPDSNACLLHICVTSGCEWFWRCGDWPHEVPSSFSTMTNLMSSTCPHH